ncbi:hypothetical protein PRZ48_012358 [Zasmidium cellare]|uniref:Uncharacterized protein n=1 Tax=Zasmidium cellare TaxID=395010 RepID=A0ABR0E5K2_ZASCE|nr:hypothetical protein PRZ48_012358 [Zasmidium cellare]
MSGTSTPRSRSRSKRSTTNLSDLRLAPLSTRFVEPPPDRKTPKSPYEETPDAYFTRQHPSYIHGKSAPSTPGILSRSSSRKNLGAGLSRKSSVYEEDDADDEVSYSYAAPVRHFGGERAEVGSGQIPKAKSDAALLLAQGQQRRDRERLAGQGVPLSKRHRYTGRPKSGMQTPKRESGVVDDSWLTHTGAITSALVQEGKGQSWLASRESSTSLAVPESEDDEDDDHYEEMAALNASTAKLQLAAFDGGSPVSTRPSRSGWGSRYGSRSASRRTSRLASPEGTRTPRRADVVGYFDSHEPDLPEEEPGFVNPQDRNEELEAQLEVERLTTSKSFGMGNIVDRLMNFNLFKVDEGAETTDDESVHVRDDETLEEAKQRMAAELKRRREEKEKLVSQPPPAPLGDGQEQGEGAGWKDAAWLLSVASKAMF